MQIDANCVYPCSSTPLDAQNALLRICIATNMIWVYFIPCFVIDLTLTDTWFPDFIKSLLDSALFAWLKIKKSRPSIKVPSPWAPQSLSEGIHASNASMGKHLDSPSIYASFKSYLRSMTLWCFSGANHRPREESNFRLLPIMSKMPLKSDVVPPTPYKRDITCKPLKNPWENQTICCKQLNSCKSIEAHLPWSLLLPLQSAVFN